MKQVEAESELSVSSGARRALVGSKVSIHQERGKC